MTKLDENTSKLEEDIACLRKQVAELEAENERLKVELQAKEQFCHILFNKTQDFIFIHRYEAEPYKMGHFIEVNDKVCEVLGYSREALRTLTPHQICAQEDAKEFEATSAHFIKEKRHLFEKTLITKSGEKIPVEINAILFDANGETLVVAIARDISRKKKMERRLLENELLFREFIERSPFGTTLVVENGLNTKPIVNQALADFLEYEKSELEAVPIKDFLAKITHPDDLTEEYELIDELHQGSITNYHLLKRFITKNKNIAYGEVTVMHVRDEAENVHASCAIVQNVTERRNYELALMERERLFRETFTTIPDAALLWEYKSDGRIILAKANVSAYIASESEIGQFIGRAVEDFFEDDRKTVTKIRTVLKTGLRHHEQGFFPHLRTGKKRWLLIDYIKVGENYVLNINRDISELKAAELEIQENLKLESLLSRISAKFVNIPMSQLDAAIHESLAMIGSFVRVDRVGMVAFSFDGEMSPSIAYQWLSQPLRNRNFSEKKPLSYFPNLIAYLRHYGSLVIESPEDAPEWMNVPDFNFKASVKVLLEEEANAAVVITVDCLNFEKVWPKNIVGKLRFIGRVFLNAIKSKQWKEALQKSQRQIRLIADSLPAMISYIGTDLRYIFANKGYEKAFVKPNEKIIGHTIRDVIGEQTYEKMGHYVDQVLSGAMVHYEGEVRFLNGEKCFMDVQFIPDKNEQGEVLGFFVYANDVTDRKKAEEERKKLESQLRQSLKMQAIGTLAGGIAHDFNNILAMIMGYAELSREDLSALNQPADSEIDENLKGILVASKRAKELVNQILTFSHRTEHEKGPIQIGSIVKEIAKMFRSTIPATIDISANVKASNTNILGDATQIHQVLMNLCTNAVQAMSENGGKLVLSVENARTAELMGLQVPDLQNKSYLKISIADTGGGIPREILDRIYEPYFTTKEKGKGTGMGLAVVHGIVKSHQGYIAVESELKNGTAFHVYFPLIEKVKEEAKPLLEESFRKGMGRIMLVDDETLIVNVQKKFLVQLGYQVASFTSSIDAFEALRDNPSAFDLVVTDLSMPMISGDKLAMEIKKIRPDLPVILCTGFSEKINEETAKNYGIDKFLIKPFGKAVLVNALRELLGEREP
ncbi:PAS/PAC sensor hybrid histidine kinase [Chloroherpeton thalassium ATCC 35110]|uniref:histidine kinase n=1 Tax=Chloroherpeton thalassium (strain ATCC 35110 / GB-78) TaxID=517418 RepID=B3QYV2_CHLT3|nr:PAS domain S-box protein [Chloroherpeton thalassium]ACF15175.1 PAS/PAC sensor hybrid histidine kinase [Chloroherpeton thalassium ATCC 35110]